MASWAFFRPMPFRSRTDHSLPNVIAEKVQQRGWRTNWRRVLEIQRDPAQQRDADVKYQDGTTRRLRYFHALVHNLHRMHPAVHTYAYLDRITDLERNVDLPVRTVELKWAGINSRTCSLGRVDTEKSIAASSTIRLPLSRTSAPSLARTQP
jgi:hypothetical protein